MRVLSRSLPRLSQQNHQPDSPGMRLMEMCHWEQKSGSPSALRGIAVEGGGISYGVQGKSVLGLHRIYGGMVRGGTKGGKKEGFR